jgi:hypothetical protein
MGGKVIMDTSMLTKEECEQALLRLAKIVFGSKFPESKYLDFKDYKYFCRHKKIKPSHYTSLMLYKKERGL